MIKIRPASWVRLGSWVLLAVIYMCMRVRYLPHDPGGKDMAIFFGLCLALLGFGIAAGIEGGSEG
jgi:hypothetical protein